MERSPIIDIIKKVNPAVVSIVISKILPEHFDTVPYQGFVFQVPHSKEKANVGGGSGFIVSNDGFILTNRHIVVDPDAEYTIITSDNGKYPTKILDRDEINDVAILKIDGENFPFVKLGDSKNLDLGQTILAFGNALGQFQNTVSSGIISGLSRFITAQTGIHGEQERLRGLIQTDAAINPGNSGGPLVDIEGEAIGINTATVLGAQNIGFAIPINAAKKDFEQLKKFGRIKKPFLGVRYFLINSEFQKEYNLPVDYGALVMKEELPQDFAVLPGSEAEKSGVKERDIILECANEKITDQNTLQDILQKHEIGEALPFKILRAGKTRELKIVIGEMR